MIYLDMMRLWAVLCKLIQKQTYSFLSSIYGFWFAFAGVCIIFVAAFHFGEVALEWSMARSAGNFRFGRYYDNIIGHSYESRLCLPHPIDVVYTWVNGSDPNLIKKLNEIKSKLEMKLNKTDSKLKRGDSSVFRWKNTSVCPLPNCIEACKLAISGLPKEIVLPQLIAVDLQFSRAIKIEFWEDIAVISFGSKDHINNLIFKKLEYKKTSLNISKAFYTNTLEHGRQKLPATLMIFDIASDETAESLTQKIHSIFKVHVVKNISIFRPENIAVLEMIDNMYSERLKKYTKLNGTTFSPSISSVTLVWKPVTVENVSKDNNVSPNRFADNNELRYSIRSVEKYAPWIRKIFIVTNGQIPSWLNLEHPRIELITHNEIFSNKSHLPTFSSPAIEANIHKIPGLSQKFIYMNDDVFFGKEVWPDDFYTHSKGQKIFQAWAVPNCREGCPSAWLNDKYCDKACNYTECDWDGGDCLGIKSSQNSLAQTVGSFGNRNYLAGEYCSPGCANNWLGDRYCDSNCNTKECGFDAGDCGTQNFDQLFSHVFLPSESAKLNLVKPRVGAVAMFLNLSTIFEEVIDGNFNDNAVLRSAVISKKKKILSLTFFKNFADIHIAFKILGYKGINKTNKEVLSFNVTANTKILETEKKTVLIEKPPTPKVVYPFNFYNVSLHPIIKKSVVFHDNFNQTFSHGFKERLKKIEQEYADGDISEIGFELLRKIGFRHDEKKENIGRKLLWAKNANSLDVKDVKGDDYTQIFSFLPWERQHIFHELDALQNRLEVQDLYKTHTHKSRRLLDAFASSLLHVSSIYNKEFGYQQRKIPAHMPHFVDRDIIFEMQERFQEQFIETSSHKIRHPNDMQFAFSYSYYLTGVENPKNISILFELVDTDHSGLLFIQNIYLFGEFGVLSDREIRTLVAMVHTLPINLDKIKDIESKIKNCYNRVFANKTKEARERNSHDYINIYHDKDLPLVTRDLFMNCHEIWRNVNYTNENDRKKYKYEFTGEDDVIFKMLNNNVTKVLYQLDSIRKNLKKFICINDDLDHSKNESMTIRILLRDFYESLFPIPSQFELPPGVRNKFYYKSQLMKWIDKDKCETQRKNTAIIIVVVLVILILYRRKILKFVKHFYKCSFTLRRKSSNLFI